MVLPTAVLESMITGIGLHNILPAAAPPLGFTARGLIALLVAGIGLAAGLVLARKVANAQSPSKERSRELQLKDADRHPDAPAKRPISATRELGGEGLGPVDDPWKFEDEWASDEDDGYDYDDYEDEDEDEGFTEQQDDPVPARAPVNAHIPGRRRALSVTDDSGPSDYLATVPLPGQGYDEPLELDILEEEPGEDDIALEAFAEETAAFRNDAQATGEPAAYEPAAQAPEFTAPTDSTGGDADTHAAAMFAKPVSGGSAEAENEIETSPVQEDPMSQSNEQSMPSFASPVPAASQAAADPSNAPGRNALSDLGMAELVERFAAAMQAKVEREERAEDDAPVNAAFSTGFGEANPFADRAGDADLGSFDKAPVIAPETAASLPFTSPLTSEPVEAAAVPSEFVPSDPAASQAESGEEAETAAAPMVFRRAGSSSSEADAPAADAEPAPVPQSFGMAKPMPSALRPVDMFDDDEDEEDDGTAHAPLSIDFSRQRPFADPVARTDTPDNAAEQDLAAQSPAAAPHPFAAPEPEAEEEEAGQDAYSSLLNMKSKLSGQEFVRVEEDESARDVLPEPVVVFPGQQPGQPSGQQAGYQADQNANETAGASNEAPRMFDAPASRSSSGANPVPHPTTPPNAPSDPTETERALREALEKLQRMSGAA